MVSVSLPRPHMTSNGKIGSDFQLMKVAAPMAWVPSRECFRALLTAFANTGELDTYHQQMLKRADKRDHA